MGFDYTAAGAAIAALVFWYRGAQIENRSPILWAALSVGISGVATFGFGGGWIAVILGQGAMFIGVTLYRTLADKDAGAR